MKIILDLCGGTGAWSKSYKEAGYDVRVITLPEYDVTSYTPPENIYGILAAPPCTMFSHARTRARKPRDVKGAMEIVRACQRIIWETQYDINTGEKTSPLKFWALENPGHGILKYFMGQPDFVFNPWEFGDGYKKLTFLWGWFNLPHKSPGEIALVPEHNREKLVKFDKLKTREIHAQYYGKLSRQERRAITPSGFAQAFFEANP